MSRILGSLLGVAALFALAMPSRADQTPPAGYVTSETCGACHDEIYKGLARNPHNAVETGTANTGKMHWKGMACESCHGPGAKHAESTDPKDIRNPLKMTPVAVDKTCLECHRNRATQVGRIQSSHARDDVPCTTCHQIHGRGAEARAWKKPAEINVLCGSCHASARAQFDKPYRHKIPEGAMSCVDCHNPHGGFRPGMMQNVSANEPGCLKCHSDLRGPFTFEHSPMRMEGCASCHEPHGSGNPRMLIRQEVKFVCLECHANLPSAVTAKTVLGVVPSSQHDLRSPVFRNCTVCHTRIHGSYVDRYLQK